MHAVLRVVCFGCTLCLALLSEVAAGQDSNPASARAGPSIPTEGDQTAQQQDIRFADGHLSAHFKNLPLESLGNALSQKAGIAVVFLDNSGSQKVSASFEKLPMDEGLRRILQKQDVFFFYSADQKQPSCLKAVWIFPNGKGRGVAPVPPEQWASTKDLGAQLKASEPAARAKAIETLIQRKGNEVSNALLESLADHDSQVRERALFASMQSGVAVPSAVLNQMTHDTSSDVRYLALRALSDSGSPDALSAAEQAASDPNEAVRNEAQEIISRLDKHSEEPEEQPPSNDLLPH
jgi:hypothetical protein